MSVTVIQRMNPISRIWGLFYRPLTTSTKTYYGKSHKEKADYKNNRKLILWHKVAVKSENKISEMMKTNQGLK